MERFVEILNCDEILLLRHFSRSESAFLSSSAADTTVRLKLSQYYGVRDTFISRFHVFPAVVDLIPGR